jgi:hypothetical protein
MNSRDKRRRAKKLREKMNSFEPPKSKVIELPSGYKEAQDYVKLLEDSQRQVREILTGTKTHK